LLFAVACGILYEGVHFMYEKCFWEAYSMTKIDVNFKPKARLLLQLGDRLIRNEAIAIFELVKNCYDANSPFAKVSFIDLNTRDKGTILIEDEGDGMDLDIIENVWMQPRTDNKETVYNTNKDNPEYKKRLPIGEEGIERFGAYKLGNTIGLISKKEDTAGKKYNEIRFTIDWSKAKPQEMTCGSIHENASKAYKVIPFNGLVDKGCAEKTHKSDYKERQHIMCEVSLDFRKFFTCSIPKEVTEFPKLLFQINENMLMHIQNRLGRYVSNPGILLVDSESSGSTKTPKCSCEATEK
jgi:hypothetical protein